MTGRAQLLGSLLYCLWARISDAGAANVKNSTCPGWTKPLASTAIISILPTLILPIIPLTRTDDKGAVSINQGLQQTLLSFAAGGLLGDVFLHSLPHLLKDDHHHHHDDKDDHDHVHGDDSTAISLFVLAGFVLFFIAEKVVKLLVGEDGHSHHHHHRRDEHEHAEPPPGAAQSSIDDAREVNGVRRRKKPSTDTDDKVAPQSKVSDKLAGTVERGGGGALTHLKASGYLNIAVDALHNLTDGIAIGASYSVGDGLGLAATISIFLHEIPHEIADFCILVQSGLSMRAAFLMQFATAITALIGTYIGLVSTRHEGLEKVLLCLTSGGFLYIAAVTVLPELLREQSTLRQSLQQVAGLCAGIGIMWYVAMTEEH